MTRPLSTHTTAPPLLPVLVALVLVALALVGWLAQHRPR